MDANRELPITKGPNWWLFCTGGILTTGGLGWCLRLAYAEQPKAAIVSYLAGSAGICLTNMAFFCRSGKKAKTPHPNWFLLLTGGILSGTGFGYCLTFGLKENPKSTVMAYAAGSLGYCLVNAAIYTAIASGKGDKSSNQKIADVVTASNARFHFMGSTNQCEKCKAHVDEEILKRKNGGKQSKGILTMRKSSGLQRNVKKIGQGMKHVEHEDLVAEETPSRVDLNLEMDRTCQDIEEQCGHSKNIKHESEDDTISSRKQFPGNEAFSKRSGEIEHLRYINDSPCDQPDLGSKIIYLPTGYFVPTDSPSTPLCEIDIPQLVNNLDGCRMPVTVPNKLPDVKSTQTESQLRIAGTQTEESVLVCLKETAMKDPTTTYSQSEVDAEGAFVEDQLTVQSTSSVLVSESQKEDLLEVPTEDQRLELEDKE